MNYTRSKLTKTTSVPTIYFDEEGDEHDLLEAPTDWVTANRKNMPSPGYLVPSTKSRTDIDESADHITILNTSMSSPLKRTFDVARKVKSEVISIKQETPSKPEIRILNKLPATTISLNNQVHTLNEIKQIVKKSPATVKALSSPPEKRMKPNPSAPKIISQQVFAPAAPVYEEDPLQSFEYQIEQVPEPKPKDNSEEIKTLLKEVSEMKSILNEKLKQPAPSVNPPKLNESSNINQSLMNKTQLFNGIKRYLSPSLIALLRMEIFGAPSREYKKDEKIICSELLKLGDETYDFFSDEWRLRLPSKDTVKSWKLEEMTDDDAS